MIRRNRVGPFLLSLLALLVLAHEPLFAQVVYSPVQLRLNTALTFAVERNDTAAPLSLIDAGADANFIRIDIDPTPSIPQQVPHMLQGRTRSAGTRIPDASPWEVVPGMLQGRTRSTAIYTSPPLLVLATLKGNTRLVTALLDHGAHPDAKALIVNTIPPTDPVNALQIAVLNNRVEIVRTLLKHRASPRDTASLGDSLLRDTRNAAILTMLRQVIPKDTQVWADFKTREYHFPETRWYGKTKEGDYMSEQDAIHAGYRAAERWQDYLCR